MNKTLVFFVVTFVVLAGCDRKPAAESTQAPTEAPAPVAPAPVTVEETIERSAVVEAINLEKRLVTLRSDDGEVATVQVSDAVRNLPQVKVGDRVTARYYQAIGASLATSATPDATTIDLAAERAPEGALPAGAVGRRLTVPVTIVAVMNDGRQVSVYGDDGLMRVIEVRRPEGQAFARGLKQGDKVELTYTEALAISLDPVGGAPAP